MIRLFAALPIPPEIADGLTRRQHGLPHARWRPDDVFHITLRFFGEVDETTAADLDGALAGVRAEPFELSLTGVGAFGGEKQHRAAWAGVSESEPMSLLAGRCEATARQVGLPAEKRPYHPHVTLAYLNRQTPAPRVAEWIAEHNLLRSPPWRAERFGLYSSWSGGEGSSYTLERDYSLIPADA